MEIFLAFCGATALKAPSCPLQCREKAVPFPAGRLFAAELLGLCPVQQLLFNPRSVLHQRLQLFLIF